LHGQLLRHPQVLFFDDADASLALSPRFQALYKQFPEWEEHSSGMHQYIVWTALAAEGLGCNLQHYQRALGQYLREEYSIKEAWNCKAQLVFGSLGDDVYIEREKTGLADAMRVYE
jgi:predicted oxidoreductase (fatty acid repression mutant protein)